MIGVDIGGTNLLVGRIEHGKVVERMHQPIVARGDFEAVASQVCEAITTLGGNDIPAVGISVAGSVDAQNGIVLRAENLNWDNAPLATYVRDTLSCKVVIENDATAAAWGEFNYGAGVGSNSLFAVWIGTGIGGGLILDGSIWRGTLGTGGEFGMGISERNGDSSGRVLEAFASRSGFQRILHNNALDTNALQQGYGKEEPLTTVINDGAARIGTSIANVITLLSLDKVILGGGLIEALGERYVQTIRTQFLSDVFPSQCKKCDICVTTLGPDAGLLGAATLAKNA
jgi:glucokinase